MKQVTREGRQRQKRSLGLCLGGFDFWSKSRPFSWVMISSVSRKAFSFFPLAPY